MPVYSGTVDRHFLRRLGLPGLCGFIGEVFVVLSVWNYSQVLAVISASVVILTAGYILWAMQRVYLGPEYKGPHGEAHHADDPARIGHCRAAAGLCDSARRVPASLSSST